MPSSLEALIVVVVFVLPGGLFHWTYERAVGGAWTYGLDDRVLRFVRSSAVLHLLLLPLTWVLFRRLQALDIQASFDLALWGYGLAFILVPSVIGSVAAIAHQRGVTRRIPLIGGLDAPRAWDHAFQGNPSGWVRIRLDSGVWVAGLLGEDESGRRSFVSAFPRERDMYLVRRVDVDAETGEWNTDAQGSLVVMEPGIIVGWDKIDLIEFFPVDTEETG